jgi:transcriptional regulator with XRE-family HTH domain
VKLLYPAVLNACTAEGRQATMPGQLSPLGRLIDNRRAELDLKLLDVAEAAGLSIEALRAIRYGENDPRGTSLAAIDRALQWKPGSAGRFVTDGTEPEPAGGARPEPDLFSDDPVAKAIMAQEHKSKEQRRRELGDWLIRDGAQRALQFPRNKRGTIASIR